MRVSVFPREYHPRNGRWRVFEQCTLVGCFRKVPNLPDARPAPRHLVGRAVPKPDPERSANVHSGEVTRRWVLYGPVGAGLMPAGDYQFLYYEGEELVLTQIVSYIPQTVGYPMDIVSAFCSPLPGSAT